MSCFSVYGQKRWTNSDVDCFHSALSKRIGRKRPSFGFFLTKLKSVANSYKNEAISIRDGKVSRKYKYNEAKTVDRFIPEAEEKIIANRYNVSLFRP